MLGYWMVKLQFPINLLLPDFSFLLFGAGAQQMSTLYPSPLAGWAWATWFLWSEENGESSGLHLSEPLMGGEVSPHLSYQAM